MRSNTSKEIAYIFIQGKSPGGAIKDDSEADLRPIWNQAL
jgi:hypothetical protein